MEDQSPPYSFGDDQKRRLSARLDAALLATRSPNVSPTSAYESGGQSSFVDPSAETPGNLRRGVSECRRVWQRTKKERLLLQHTYSPGGTSRRFYAHVSTKFQDTTIVSLGGKAAFGPNRSQELSDEMADG